MNQKNKNMKQVFPLMAAVVVGAMVCSWPSPLASAEKKPRPLPGPNVKDAPGWRDVASTTKDAEGFVPLFDGKTFNGWEGAPKRWRIEDGSLVGGNLKQGGRSEYLCTVKEYPDFELRVKWKALNLPGLDTNGGIQFRSNRIGGGQVMGYQADLGTLKGYLNGKFWGLLFDNCRRATLAGDSEANEKIVKMRDWNQYFIRAQGRRIQQWLNGHRVVDYTEKGPYELTGIIGLQIHAGPPMEVWYKDIAIKELPAEASPSATGH